MAIVLGVALVSGTYVLTDSITKAFDSIFQTIYQQHRRHDHRPQRDRPGANDAGAARRPSFDESLLAKVRALPEVRDAIGGVAGEPQLVKNGKAISFGGAPEPRLQRRSHAARVRVAHAHAGHVAGGERGGRSTPARPARSTSKSGDTIGVQAQGPVQQMQGGRARELRLGGARSAARRWPGFTLPTAQRLFDKQGKLDDIRVAARAGGRPQQLVHADPDDPAARHAGADGRRAGAEVGRRHQLVPRRSSRHSCSRSPASRCSWAAS